ncbi:MAG: SHD1 domain-containing protein [Thermoguttaceae bacterium]
MKSLTILKARDRWKQALGNRRQLVLVGGAAALLAPRYSGGKLMILQRRLLFSVTLLVLLGQLSVAREWADATGQFKTEAELVKVEGDKVLLKKQSDGATIQVPIARLSPADQAYLKSLDAPQAADVTTAAAPTLPLHTAGCIGLMVIDPKPVLKLDALKQAPLKDLVDKGVAQAGIDFRKLDAVTAYFLKPAMEGPTGSAQSNAVAVARFADPVDPAPMLAKLPVKYEAVTVAGKPCQKPAAAPYPWVCSLDEKTLAFSMDEASLNAVLSATADDPDLARLIAAADAKNEVRYVLNMAPLKDLLVKTQAALPPAAADGVKILDVVRKIDSFQFTTDLDGTPAIELLLQVADPSQLGDVEKAVKDGLAKLPELAKAGMATGMQAAGKQPSAPAMPMDPAMITQMLGGMGDQLDKLLAFEKSESALKISIKFPPNTPPLVETLSQMGSAMAMMSQQSGAGGAPAPKQ